MDVEASEDDRSFDMAAPEFSAFSVDSNGRFQFFSGLLSTAISIGI